MVKERGFAEMMRDLVKDRLGDGYDVNLRDVMKNNGTELTGLSIGAKDARIAPTIYLEGFEERFEQGRISVNEAVEEIIKVFRKEDDQDAGFLYEIFSNVEEIYKRVCPKIINAERNAELLKTVPFVKFLDLAEIFVVKMEISGNTGNVTINNDLMERLGIDIEKLKDSAYGNMKKRGIEQKSLSSMIKDLIFDSGEVPEELNEPEGISMMVVTNRERYNGACCMIDPEIFVDLSEKMGCDLYVLPSSIHEIIVVPAVSQCNEDELRDMVRDVNRSSVSNEDFLSDTLYRYNRGTAQLQIA